MIKKWFSYSKLSNLIYNNKRKYNFIVSSCSTISIITKKKFRRRSTLAMTMLLRMLIVLPNYLDFSLLYGSLGGGWQGGVASGWRGCSDSWGQGLQGILYCMTTERGIRWVRYHSVFWSRLSEVNSQWPWGLGWEERGGGGCGVGEGIVRAGVARGTIGLISDSRRAVWPSCSTANAHTGN